jgi:energy-coupling factor transporter ATP-binding protein EcfA2
MEPVKVDWINFLYRFRWYQGEHLSIIGPTGSGKTTLLLSLLHRRSNVAIFATKPYPPKDELESNTLAAYAKKARYTKLPYWTPGNTHKIVLWPSFKRPGDETLQRKVFTKALMDIFVARGWCIAVDELWYHTNRLKLNDLFETFWSQGREQGLTVAAATQRPSHISLMFYSEPKHFFFYRLRNPNDRKRISEIASIDHKAVQDRVMRLPDHHFLYLHAPSGEMIESSVQL